MEAGKARGKEVRNPCVRAAVVRRKEAAAEEEPLEAAEGKGKGRGREEGRVKKERE